MGYKIERVTERIREEVAKVLLSDLKDPRLGFVTVTRVTVTRDMKQATVFVSVLGSDADVTRTLHALTHAEGFLTTRVARCLTTRITPRVRIEFDPTIERAVRMSRLIDEAVQSGRKEGEGEPTETGDPA